MERCLAAVKPKAETGTRSRVFGKTQGPRTERRGAGDIARTVNGRSASRKVSDAETP